jgi:IMP dehydrogenase
MISDSDEWLSYDDVMLKPQRSPVESRDDVDLTMNLTPSIELDVPVIAAPMDSVCGPQMATAMNSAGATGFVHRFIEDPTDHAQAVLGVENGPRVGVVGINGESKERARALASIEGLDIFCVNVAHGHLEKSIKMIEWLTQEFDTEIIAGNVATYQGAKDLYKAGADTVKVGIGPGSACTTRQKTGVGVPQITAIQEVRAAADKFGGHPSGKRYVIADGGMKTPGDVAKAIMAGADTAMLGSYFAGCPEAPMDGIIRGMASNEAQSDNGKGGVAEGGVKTVESGASASEAVSEIAEGLASASSYCGAETLSEARENAEFIRVTDSAVKRAGLH